MIKLGTSRSDHGGLRVTVSPVTRVLVNRKEATETLGRGRVKTEAEIGVMLPQAKECLETQELEMSRKYSR